MKTFSVLAAALAGAVIASPAIAQAVMSPADYVAAAGASDLYERQSSELVSQSTKDMKVREFAQMMIAHHTKSTADVTTAARQANVPVPPPSLNAEQAAMMTQLRAAKGTARDAAYIAQQKTAHAQALTLHQTYAAAGTSAPLRTVAAAVVPVVQQHIDRLKTM